MDIRFLGIEPTSGGLASRGFLCSPLLYPLGCTSGGLALTGRVSSPTWSFRSAAACTSPAAKSGSEVAFAILSSAAAASRAWKWFLDTGTHVLFLVLFMQH